MATPRWYHLWGPAIIAAAIGAIPGTIALLNLPPETRVELKFLSATARYEGQVPTFTVEALVVNDSQHAVGARYGRCFVTGDDGDVKFPAISATSSKELTDLNVLRI